MQDTTDKREFDFDYWSEMAERDPETFEVLREASLAALIDEAPGRLRQRLRGLQWQIDQARKRADNPMSSCLQVYRMMWDTVLGHGGLLQALENPETLLKTDDKGHNVVRPGGWKKDPLRGN